MVIAVVDPQNFSSLTPTVAESVFSLSHLLKVAFLQANINLSACHAAGNKHIPFILKTLSGHNYNCKIKGQAICHRAGSTDHSISSKQPFGGLFVALCCSNDSCGNMPPNSSSSDGII